MPRDMEPTTIFIDFGWRPNSQRHRANMCAANNAVAEINDDTTVLPHTILRVRYHGTNCSRDAATEVALDLLGLQSTVLVGPGCSGASMAMSPILTHGSLPR